MTAVERAERLSADLTPQQRVALAREDAEDFCLDAYSEPAAQRQGGVR